MAEIGVVEKPPVASPSGRLEVSPIRPAQPAEKAPVVSDNAGEFNTNEVLAEIQRQLAAQASDNAREMPKPTISKTPGENTQK